MYAVADQIVAIPCPRRGRSIQMNCKDCRSDCYEWPHRPSRDGDPLRQLNRCCDPSCCIQRALPRPSHLYTCTAVNNLDAVTVMSIPSYQAANVEFCNLLDDEWNSASIHESKRYSFYENSWARLSFDERERHSMIMRENYKREIEVLKTKLNQIKDNVLDGKRCRHRCDSEPGCQYRAPAPGRSFKRARERSPTYLPSVPTDAASRHRQPRPTCRSPPIPRNSFKRETRSLPPSLHSDPHRALQTTVKHSEHAFRRKLPDYCLTEDEASLSCEDVSVGYEAIENISEDDISIQSDLTYPSNESISSEGKMAETQDAPSYVSVFRPSLFLNVPPYLAFASHDLKGPFLPPEISKLLKWRLSTITPVVIRRTLSNTGFKFVRKSNDWSGQWGKHMNSFLFKTLKDFQKLNHFPGTFQIGRKDKLWKNLNRLMLKFGKREFGFIPTTYILPQDHKSLRLAWEKASSKGQWIVKPPAAARGTGIRVVHRWSDVPKNKPLIVQKYISQPYLINGSKFDLRLYVLMTSIHPLRIYLYEDGLVRFASVKYSNNMESLSDRFMHLTNYSINKLSNQYCANEDASSCQGHKWTLKSLWLYFRKQGVNVEALQRNLSDLIIKTIISGESQIQALSKNNLPSRYCSYELFGIDVLLDSALRPWLLEVNISPSLHSTSPLDLAVKGPLVRELFNLVGFQVPAKLTKEQESGCLAACCLGQKTSRFCYDKRLYTTALSRLERMKHASYNVQPRSEYLSSILENLTPDDVRHLIQFEDELTQLERFQKVFPTSQTHSYHQFFDSPRYYNMLLDSWENKYQHNRDEGVKLLNSFCQMDVHLEVPFTGAKTKSSASRSLRRDKVEEIESDGEDEWDDGDMAKCQVKRRKTKLARSGGLRVSCLSRRLRTRLPPQSDALISARQQVITSPDSIVGPNLNPARKNCS